MPRKSRQSGFSLIELLIVVAVALIIGAFAVPNFLTALRNYRIAGNLSAINGEILLAKMRASARFTQTRVRFNRIPRTFFVEWWDKTNRVWTQEAVGAPTTLSSGVFYGFDAVAMMPPAGSGVATTMADACLDDTALPMPGQGAPIGATFCIVFNSRGYPIDAATSNPEAGAIYINDGVAVHGVTLTAAGRNRLWRTGIADTAGAEWLQR